MSHMPTQQPPDPGPPWMAGGPVPVGLDYSTPSRVGQRPGVLSTVAIISIVLGAIGLLNNGMGLISVVMQMAMSRGSGSWAQMTTTTTTSSSMTVTVTSSRGTATTTASGGPTSTPATAPSATPPAAGPVFTAT